MLESIFLIFDVGKKLFVLAKNGPRTKKDFWPQKKCKKTAQKRKNFVCTKYLRYLGPSQSFSPKAFTGEQAQMIPCKIGSCLLRLALHPLCACVG